MKNFKDFKKIKKYLALSTGALLFIFQIAHATPPVDYSMVGVYCANDSDPSTGFGSVNDNYQMGVYEVTIGQYTAFLNAVAYREDTYGLYNSNMANILNTAGISRSGSPGSYVYTVMNNGGDSSNRPITNVSWFDAARFANWMSNGQPTSCEISTTTENGAYDLSGVDYFLNKNNKNLDLGLCAEHLQKPIMDMAQPIAPARNQTNPNTDEPPLYYIPTENQWYKAAYYDRSLNDYTGGYYLYATGTNVIHGNDPSETQAPGYVNYLNESSGYAVTQSAAFSLSQNYLTDVGNYAASHSSYETFDQTGNVWEWNDLDGTASVIKGLRGGAYTSTLPYLKSSYRMGYIATGSNPNAGFRLAGSVRNGAMGLRLGLRC